MIGVQDLDRPLARLCQPQQGVQQRDGVGSARDGDAHARRVRQHVVAGNRLEELIEHAGVL